MKHLLKSFINGSWQEGKGSLTEKINPGNGKTLASFQDTSTDQIDEAVSSSWKAFSNWKTLSLNKRLEWISSFESQLDKNSKHLAEVISQETGKPLWESKQEVSAMQQKIAISIDAFKNRTPIEKQKLPQAMLYTRHEPHGVVAVLGPFNFPGHLPQGHIVPALIAGNAVIFKPSEETPVTAVEMMKLWEKAGLPKGVLQLVLGGPKVGKALATHSKISGLYFTGSWKTGSKLLEQFQKHPEKILALEMGGNNPLVVTKVKDKKAASYLTVLSAYLTSGQRCSCARRLIVPKGREGDAFIDELLTLIPKLQVGYYENQPEPFMGPVINEKSANNLLKAQETLIKQGGLPLIKLKRLPIGKSFLSPGVIDTTSIKNRPDEEYFGPLLQLIRTPDFDSAINEANQTAFGLSAGLLSDDPKQWQAFYRTVRAGIINWNTQITGASSKAPFGGIGKSGNFRPGAYYAADYCAYPVVSMENEQVFCPQSLPPGIP